MYSTYTSYEAWQPSLLKNCTCLGSELQYYSTQVCVVLGEINVNRTDFVVVYCMACCTCLIRFFFIVLITVAFALGFLKPIDELLCLCPDFSEYICLGTSFVRPPLLERLLVDLFRHVELLRDEQKHDIAALTLRQIFLHQHQEINLVGFLSCMPVENNSLYDLVVVAENLADRSCSGNLVDEHEVVDALHEGCDHSFSCLVFGCIRAHP